MRISKGDCPHAGDCNFEDGSLCRYENTPDSQIRWVVAKGASNTQVTGPLFDHTFGNTQGAYAVLGEHY